MLKTQRAPVCLHVPPLCEGVTAALSWEGIEGAAAYQLECVFDETFDSASKGQTWGDLHDKSNDWADIPPEGNWDALAQSAAQGQSWQSIAFGSLSWESLGDSDWKELHRQQPCYTIYTGTGTRAASTWDTLHACCFDWEAIHGEEESWPSASGHGCERLHFEWEVPIPRNKKTVQFRLRALTEDGDEHEATTTALLPVEPLYTRRSNEIIRSQAGEKNMVLLHARDLEEFYGAALKLTYSAFRLSVKPYEAHLQYGINLGLSESNRITQFYPEDGRIRFRLERCPDGKLYHGPALVLQTDGLRPGNSAITLS